MEAGLTPRECTYLAGLALFLFLLLAAGLSFIEYDFLYNPMSLFLFFTLFVLVLVIYLIFFKMMYLSYEKLQSQHDADQVRHLLSVHIFDILTPYSMDWSKIKVICGVFLRLMLFASMVLI